MYSRLKHFYKKHRNYIKIFVFGIVGFYMFIVETGIDFIPIGALVMYAEAWSYIKKFFAHEASRKE